MLKRSNLGLEGTVHRFVAISTVEFFFEPPYVGLAAVGHCFFLSETETVFLIGSEPPDFLVSSGEDSREKLLTLDYYGHRKAHPGKSDCYRKLLTTSGFDLDQRSWGPLRNKPAEGVFDPVRAFCLGASACASGRCTSAAQAISRAPPEKDCSDELRLSRALMWESKRQQPVASTHYPIVDRHNIRKELMDVIYTS